MLEKLNKIYEQIISEAKKPAKKVRVRVKKNPSMNQNCKVTTKKVKTKLTQKKK